MRMPHLQCLRRLAAVGVLRCQATQHLLVLRGLLLQGVYQPLLGRYVCRQHHQCLQRLLQDTWAHSTAAPAAPP